MRGYLSGPMTGYRHFNIEAFDAAAESLRGEDHDVTSPAELDNPETRALALASEDGSVGSGSANGETYGDFLARDVKLLFDGGFDVIWVLPGWQNSTGAALETFIHTGLLGKATIDYETRKTVSLGVLSSVWQAQMYSNVAKHKVSEAERVYAMKRSNPEGNAPVPSWIKMQAIA